MNWSILMKDHTAASLLVAFIVISASNAAVAAKDDDPAPVLRLPRPSIELKIVQRHSQVIPGSNDTLRIQIGDITKGQMSLWVITSQGKKLIDSVAMSEGGTTAFTIQGQKYTIRLRKLHDLPFGDFAILVVSGKPASAPQKPITLKIDDDTTIEAVYIAPATFEMGRDTTAIRLLFYADTPHHGINEGPLRRVTITKGFYIARYKVTCDAFCKFLNSVDMPQRYASVGLNWFSRIQFKDGRYVPKPGVGNCAINVVEWEGTKEYCKWLSMKTGHTVRLPTEAEWELTARGPEGRQFPWGHEPLTEPWTYDEKDKDKYPHFWSSAPVDAFPQNATPDGVVGMVARGTGEWCSDIYAGRYLPKDTLDPQGPLKEDFPIIPDIK